MAAIERHNLEYASHKVRVPVPESFSGLSVHDCVNRFLNQKLDEQDAGQISERWYSDLYKVCQFILEQFGRDRAIESIEPNDFAKMRLVLVKKHSPTISRNLVSRVKSVFKFAKDTHLIDNEVDYGVSFKPPSKALVRKHRATKPKALWTPEQVNAMVDKCNTTMRAMILLAINSGVNNSDIANLPICQSKPSTSKRVGWIFQGPRLSFKGVFCFGRKPWQR